MSTLKSLLRKITSRESLNIQSNMIEGTYKRLMDPSSFNDLLYPGIDVSFVKGAPTNIYELLKVGSVARMEVDARLESICESAYKVLEGVRRRGAERGDVMDRATEAVLIPQISGESFALAVIAIVKALNQKASAEYAQRCLTVASPQDERAQRDQLENDTAQKLMGKNGYVYLDEFLGEDWVNLVRSDMKRYVITERMGEVDSDTIPVGSKSKPKSQKKIAWIEYENIKDEYPALAEAINCLHALPFELNGITSLLELKNIVLTLFLK